MAEIDALAVAPPITLPTSDQIAAFERDGHLHIPGALTAGAMAATGALPAAAQGAQCDRRAG